MWGFISAVLLGLAQLSSEEPTAGEKARPSGSPGSWIRTDDYPVDSLREREEGTTVFVLDVDAGGAVAGCRVVESSGFPRLDAATCALLTARATFTPGRDAKGNAVPSTFSSRVAWRIPAAPIAMGTVTTAIQIDLDEKGRIEGCRILEGMVKNADPCREYRVGRAMVPIPSADGTPAKGRVTMRMTTTVEPR